MPVILSVETNGSLKEMSVLTGELYKKAGYKVATGFELRTTWNVECDGKQYEIELYGKNEGRAGHENKYEMPPPVDSMLLFGRCLLRNKIGDLKIEEWTKIYNKLYGGFEDLDEDDEEESAEETDLPMTKSGYAKDGFVVDEDEEDEDEEYEEEKQSKKKKAKPVKIPKTKINKAVVRKETEDELEEEPYI
jgi:hypothetical protein